MSWREQHLLLSVRPKPCDGDDPPLKGVDFVGRRKESLLGHFSQEVQRNQTQTLYFLFFLRGKESKFSLLVAFLTSLHVQTLVSGCSPAKLRFVTLGHLPCSHMGRSFSAPGADWRLKLSAVPVMMVNAEFYSDFFKLFQLGADTRGETQPGDRAAAPAEALPIPVPTHQAGGTTGTAGKWELAADWIQGLLPPMVETGCRDLLLLTHPLLQQAEVTAVSCAGKRMPWAPLQWCLCPSLPPLPLCLAQPFPGLAWAAHQPCSLGTRWAQNILHEQHLTLQGSLCPQQGQVAAAGCPKQLG